MLKTMSNTSIFLILCAIAVVSAYLTWKKILREMQKNATIDQEITFKVSGQKVTAEVFMVDPKDRLHCIAKNGMRYIVQRNQIIDVNTKED